MRRHVVVTLTVFLVLVLTSAAVSAQINFPKSSNYVAMGDSVAAGEGALPVTFGYVYQLYDQGAFGPKQETDFSSMALRGARSWDLRDHQVPQVLCVQPGLHPTIVTITAGANDFFRGDLNVSAIAQRVADSVNLLLNNDNQALVASPVLDPITSQPCPALQNVTILVSNYYSIPHPIPLVFQQLDAVLQGFDQALRFWLSLVNVPDGARLAVVDLYTPSLGRRGLVTIERRLGFEGPFDFDVHPTNLGHSFIAHQFQRVWTGLP